MKRLLGWWARLWCVLADAHAYGEAAYVGLPAGVICYACGHRLHRCGEKCR